MLLVEDIDSNRRILNNFLGGLNLNIVEAWDGIKAVDLAKKLKPHLILMDIQMPGMDGYEATGLIRADESTRDIPVIALTATSKKDNTERINKLFNFYIQKPVSRSKLLEAISKFLPFSINEALYSEYSSTDETEPEIRGDKIQALILELEKKYIPRIADLKKILVVNNVIQFARELGELGSKTNIRQLVKYSKELTAVANSFEENQIVDKLDALNDIIKKLRKNMIRPDLTASKPPMLLLVDDIPENLKVIGKTLMGEGYDVIFASNGPKALELAANAMPNLILLDVQMPGMNGLEVCRLLKKDPRTSNIPVIFLTARNDTDDIILGFEAGGVDYITKPYNARELVLRIRNQTDLQLAREEVYQLNATKDKFFSIIAHDLRNPFQAMMGMSSLILDRLKFYDDEELKQIAGYMHKAAENGYELLQNLLGWAYTQMKKIQFTPTTINLKEAVDKCIEPIELQSVTKSISLKTTSIR
ncbi:MAG: response regulator [Bacteroidales bacterium]|nr:response regulator [Bacteroidales bacterium]